MSGALTPALANPGPLLWMAQALQTRLQAVFPANYFSFVFMPQKADRAWAREHLRRTPAVALGWNGTRGINEGGVWQGEASWTVALLTRNAGNVMNRYVGDALAPGLFAMERVAKIALHGWLIDPDGTPWTAAGTTIVNGSGNLANEDWDIEATAICGLDIAIRYEEVQPPGMEPNLPDGALIDAITWNFGEQPPLLTQTIDTGSGS